jgi:hypothetical protein
MSFKKKLLFYFIGVGLGIILVKAIWKQKGVQGTYWPSERIVYDISKKKLMYSNEAENRLDDFGISKTEISDKLKKGDFDAGILERSEDTCKYYELDGEFLQKEYSFKVLNCDSTATITQVNLNN